jgi:hypothetical protein
MKKKLTLEQIDRRNSKVMLPKLDELTPEKAQGIIIAREDGSEISLINAVYADIEWLHQSQLRHLKRLERFGTVGPCEREWAVTRGGPPATIKTSGPERQAHADNNIP